MLRDDAITHMVRQLNEDAHRTWRNLARSALEASVAKHSTVNQGKVSPNEPA